MKKSNAATFLLVVFLISACSSGPSAEEIAGTFLAETAVLEEMTAVADAATQQVFAEETAAAQATEQEAARRETAQALITPTLTQRELRAIETEVLVTDLYDQGYLSSAEGEYHFVSDFERSWAQLGWYQWHYTTYDPSDFVIRLDANWETASATADWVFSGCGFVFREGDEDHYLAYLGLDGYAYLERYTNDQFTPLSRKYFRRIELPEDGAEFLLIAQGNRMVFLVDGVVLIDRQDNALSDGELALTVLSGTNKDFGTRCELSNIDLWELD